MLEDLRKWALGPNPKTTILWLHGPAGAGKSAIMRTLASRLHEDERLGGCFFFKRGHTMRGNPKTLFATIAYQLALNIEWLRAPISQVVEKNPSILARSIETQMQELISKPFIVIDGLDEWDGHAYQGRSCAQSETCPSLTQSSFGSSLQVGQNPIFARCSTPLSIPVSVVKSVTFD
ncbi:hypothetical protein B0H14DRAFT_2937115 [Mycena olivaceomarginata]|nr:hypothetical protein B0H14DRAFT_2937115 [Mycena olivaceomarginata]